MKKGVTFRQIAEMVLLVVVMIAVLLFIFVNFAPAQNSTETTLGGISNLSHQFGNMSQNI